MNRPLDLILGSALFALLLTGCLDRKQVQDSTTPNMPHSYSRIDSMFKDVATICIGRYLIEVPRAAEIVYGPAYVHYPIERRHKMGASLDEHVADHVAAVEKRKRYAHGPLVSEDSMLGKVKRGLAPDQQLVFGLSKASGSFYDIASFIRVGDDLFVQRAEAFPEPDSYKKVVDMLTMVAGNLRARRISEIPLESGICIDGAFVAEPSKPVYEWVTLGVRFPEVPDVHFSISMTKKDVLVESDALEPRLVQAEQDAKLGGSGGWFSRIKVFRRGERQVGNWKGFEILARKPAQDGEEESHEFAFVSQGEPRNPLLPLLDLKLDSGVDGNQAGAKLPSVTDAEAIEMWDRLITSIRVRPNGGTKTGLP